MDTQRVLCAGIACTRLITLLALLIPVSAGAASSDPFFRTDFTSPDSVADWAITSGNWQVVNGEFVNNSEGALSIATVPTYEINSPGAVPDTLGGDFSLDVYALIASSVSSARVGVVFDFADPRNYHEATISATGNAQLRSRIGGVSSTVATATFAAPGANKWIHIRLVRSSGRSIVQIDGVTVFADALQDGLPEGDVGLIARNTRARFDDLDARSFGLQDPYIEDFNDGNANLWQPLSGTWSITSNAYRNSAVVATAITKTPLIDMWEVGERPSLPSYTFKVRMLNPYGASGNLVGIAWVNDAANYTEVVFSPTGQARLNNVSNGVRTTLASASYLGGGQNQWFEVEVAHNGVEPEFAAASYIKVNGVPVFDVAPNLFEGAPSLITHWSPARFDDVRAARDFFRPFGENFESDEPLRFVARRTWTFADGMMNNSTIVPASRATVQGNRDWRDLADIELRARMINRFGSSGNRVGFTYGERGPLYYEVVFSPTGVAHLRKVVRDVPIPIATSQYEGGQPGQWFDAQLLQIGGRTTVKVNGAVVFDNVPQPDAVGGGLGFVAHWTNASIDDVSFTQIPVTRYRFTALPDLPNPVVLTSAVRAINDLGEVVGLSRSGTGRVGRRGAVLWRNGHVIELGANADDGSAANDINNKSEIVGGNFGQGAFYWKDGQLQSQLFPGCDRGEALDINEHGQIVGICGAGGDGTSAVLREPDGRMATLEDLPGGLNWSSANAINERGEIVGDSSGAQSIFLDAVSWQGGMVESLGSEGSALDINNRGLIIGIVRTVPQLAVMWQDHELILLPTRPGETHAQALGMNDHGVIVGTTHAPPPANPNLQGRASVWQEGRVAELNELIVCGTLPESTLLTAAMDINERGEIAVNGFDFTVMEFKAFVLTPVSGKEACDR